MTSRKEASVSPLEALEGACKEFAKSQEAMEKSAEDKKADGCDELFCLHEGVVSNFKKAALAGRRKEAAEILDKFPGWDYLKGLPRMDGEWSPLPEFK